MLLLERTRRVACAAARRLAGLTLALLVFGVSLPPPQAQADAAAKAWVERFWREARAAGVSRRTYDAALGRFTPDPDVLRRASAQAEFVKPLWEYLDSAVSERRIADGRAALRRYERGLDEIERRYGVSRYAVVAIWGMESSYGQVLENDQIVKNTIRSLATLAYKGGRRARYGRTQLIAALKILEHGDITPGRMVGSWAGAMGHTQFIPTTYRAYAADFDGDGKRDIWTNPLDALASTANYLRVSGWRAGESWGYEVEIPAGFDWRHADRDETRPVSAWAKLGIRRVAGRAFSRADEPARLYAPAGAHGPVFLLIRNFQAIKRYNNADAYALAVGHLADRLAGYGAFVAGWPQGDRPLTPDERGDLQRALARRGHYSGAIDGKIGPGTRAAIRAYQARAGLVPDGWASAALLARMRGES
ncbi:lytic murein transglycosylase [Prosthecomicrobium pneumaticum]|uniref:Membrane-bound lytic murein transglycosylase B n=1 Tax=Prosthecomicrobium pneumaticum TaxID=81895 RepID=A0A7W9CVP8_9HYPH|nr:lytic murein transglycosylase [Prosthecomicrobium pneumaticum]MBB5752529.1 membrane-bound lytic murein transglycosylase B [Prosthecomicrobium pneumaticum]